MKKLTKKIVSKQLDIIIPTSHINIKEQIILGNKSEDLTEYFNFQKIMLRDIKKRFPDLSEIHIDLKYWVIT